MGNRASDQFLIDTKKLEQSSLRSSNAFKHFFKQYSYQLFRWFSRPAIEAQNNVNHSLNCEIDKMRQDIISIREQLNRAITSEKAAHYDHQFDYIGFENQFRGSEEAIHEKQKIYLKYFAEQQNVVDIGCGRGEFLKLLKENNIDSFGVDVNEIMIKQCLDSGLQVKKMNALAFLRTSKDNSLGGIIMNQVIEHIPFNQLVEIVALAYAKLKPSAYFIAETINPQSLIVLTEAYFLDPTHDRMIHPHTMRFLLQQSGFVESTIEYLSPVDQSEYMTQKTDSCPTIENQIDNSNDALNRLVFGYREYAVIGRKK